MTANAPYIGMKEHRTEVGTTKERIVLIMIYRTWWEGLVAKTM